MKKTYNVYSIFEKTRVSTGLKSVAMMFVLLVCFLSYSTESSAQTLSLNATPIINSNPTKVDPSIIKGTDFTQDTEAALTILRREVQSLLEAPHVDGAAAEASFASKKFFLDTAVGGLNDGGDVEGSLITAYENTAVFIDTNLGINVDLDGILTTYAGLLQ